MGIALISSVFCCAEKRPSTIEIDGRFTLPVFEAVLDDLLKLLSADSSRAVDEQPLLLERTINQGRHICLSITQDTQAIGDAGITHEREERAWEHLWHLSRCQAAHIGSQQLCRT